MEETGCSSSTGSLLPLGLLTGLSTDWASLSFLQRSHASRSAEDASLLTDVSIVLVNGCNRWRRLITSVCESGPPIRRRVVGEECFRQSEAGHEFVEFK